MRNASVILLSLTGGAGSSSFMSFSTYLPTMSFSRFTMSPTRRSDSVVWADVCGMIETENVVSVTLATVRLMPSMAIEPFSTM